MTLKYFLNKIYWAIIKPPRTVYRFVVRPKGRGVKALVKYNDAFLLVRPTYGHKLWTIPGGAVEKGESFEDAARRELFEETGVRVGSLTLFGEYIWKGDYRTDTIQCFFATTDRGDIKVDGLEIKEGGWFKFDELPKDRVSRVDKIIRQYHNT